MKLIFVLFLLTLVGCASKPVEVVIDPVKQEESKKIDVDAAAKKAVEVVKDKKEDTKPELKEVEPDLKPADLKEYGEEEESGIKKETVKKTVELKKKKALKTKEKKKELE